MSFPDINECTSGSHLCGNLLCINVPGSYKCRCSAGYEFNEAVGILVNKMELNEKLTFTEIRHSRISNVPHFLFRRRGAKTWTNAESSPAMCAPCTPHARTRLDHSIAIARLDSSWQPINAIAKVNFDLGVRIIEGPASCSFESERNA